ncbi:WD40 repeat domain-containing protein [Deinococcus aestuarii]|uniref:WD40 repeat domain-containing protein n=1 Tax=Deinococcus aestuarii TaxID=2774531 RepID=UPI001C0B9399|nr:WD40 repeat domain-containing protein [Deinococcus aestuarii]
MRQHLGLWLGLLTCAASAGAASLPIERVLTGHTGWTTGAALSPDGGQLALVSRSALFLTDRKTGRRVSLAGHTGPITAVTYTPDGRTLFSGGNDGTVRRWDSSTGKRLSTLQACGFVKDAPRYREQVTTLAVRSASDFVVGCAGQLQVWRGGRLVRTLPGTLATYSPDGQRLAVADSERPLKMYDAQTFKVRATLALPLLPRPIDVFTTPGSPSALAFSPDGSRLAVAFRDSMPKVENFMASVYDTGTGERLFDLGGQPDFVDGLAYSPDGQTLAATGRSSTKLYDARTGKQLRLLQPPNTRIGVLAVAWTPDGRNVIATSVKKGAEVLDLTGKVRQTYTVPDDSVMALTWNPAGTLLATGARDGRILLWKGTAVAASWAAHPEGVNDMSFSPDGTRLASGGQDAFLRLWDTRGQPVTALGLKSNGVGWTQFSRDGGTLLFGDWVGLFAVRTTELTRKPNWSIQPVEVALYKQGGQAAYNDPQRWAALTGGAYWQFKSSGGSTFALRLLPDGRTVRELSAASGGAALSQFDSVTGRLTKTILTAPKFGDLYAASFSPDGRRFASGRADGSTEVWSVDQRLGLQRLMSFPGEGAVYQTVFSPDGRLLAALHGDSVNVFDLEKGVEVGSYRGLSASTRAVAFNPAGTLLAVGSGTTERGGTVTVLRVR